MTVFSEPLPTYGRYAVPRTSFGPFVLWEGMPWLFFATVLRLWHFGEPVAVVLLPFAEVSIMLAFILTTRRMIELTDGHTELGKRQFVEQLRFVRAILRWLLPMTFFLAIVCVPLLGKELSSPTFLAGVDAIAFDTMWSGRLWSPVVATLMFFSVIRLAQDKSPSLGAVLSELKPHLRWVLQGYMAVVVFLFILSPIQGVARGAIMQVRLNPDIPSFVRNWVHILYILSFATVRLWAVLAILTYSFKRSCQSIAGNQ